jgi:uncharacterized membrane protein
VDARRREMIEAQYYLLLKSLHIFGIILFLGNIIITAFWKAFADFSKDWKIILFSQRLVTYTDLFFTVLGVSIIAITGIMMAQSFGDYWNVRWIRWGLGLFIASGIIWITILIPTQIVLHRLTNHFKNNKFIPKEYWMYEKIWMVFGIVATVLPLMNLYWMVFKPV